MLSPAAQSVAAPLTVHVTVYPCPAASEALTDSAAVALLVGSSVVVEMLRSGSVQSTSHDYSVYALFPASSIPVTLNVCVPSAKPVIWSSQLIELPSSLHDLLGLLS